jgi:hypothetical protein
MRVIKSKAPAQSSWSMKILSMVMKDPARMTKSNRRDPHGQR